MSNETEISQHERTNTRVMATVTVAQHVISSMKALLTKPWPKQAGIRPTDEQLMAAAAFSKKFAGCEAIFMALQMRAEGCSVLQLGQACNAGPAHNHTRDHSGKVWHHFVRGKLGSGVYTLTFTPKGEKTLAEFLKRVSTAQAAGEATEQPKAKAKPVKVKAKANKATLPAVIETPTSEAPTVTEGPVSETETPNVGGVEPAFDDVTVTETASIDQLAALAEHFNS